MIVCFSYTKLNLNAISLVLSIIFVIVGNGIFDSFNKVNLNAKVEEYYINTNEINCVSYDEVGLEIIDESLWQIEIPKINLKANIANGVTTEILNEYVGHFNETKKDSGNIGLAAHNRGYKVNYFENLKELEIGDEIIYTYNQIKRTYVVNLITIISETNWEYLENTNDNRITLITCLEDEPEYRRCIQGIEK